MTGPLVIGTTWQQGMETLGTILAREGTSLLQSTRRGRRVTGMTTTDDYRVAQLVAGIIEDTELTAPADAPETWNVKEATKLYVQSTLDNGYLSSTDDTPVWDLVAQLGHDRDDMDSLAVFHQIAALIDENDLFND